MARLIDADNIISVCEILSEKGNDTHYWNQLISIIKDMPTIAAIPVEWLKGLMLSTDDDVDNVEFAWIMREWESEQNEQEAQDGKA